MKTKHFLIAPLLSCFFASAHAATVSYSFGTVFSTEPTPPDAASPWLLMTTTDTGSNQVKLTFTALNLTGEEHVKDWYINVDPSFGDLSLLTFSLDAPSSVGNYTAPSVTKTINDHIADSGGRYDVHFQFEPGGGINERFTDNDSVSYNVSYSGAGTFNSSSFSFLGAVDGQTIYGPYISVARILSTGPTDAGSAYVSAIPEPSVTLYSVLALGLTVGLRRRR